MYKLMIVDDSNIMRQRIDRCKISGQFEVVAKAKNGIEAVELFKSCKPDLVTMDLTMPNMDGLACIRELMAINPDVLILVVSALSDKFTALTAISLGARGFLNKPFTEEQLIDAMNKVIATRR